MKIAVIGSDGQLGTDLCKIIDRSELVPLTIKDIDITDLPKSRDVLSKIKLDIIIITAAYNRVDDSEDNDIQAYKINSHGVKNMATIARDLDCVLVSISTDYVFNGEKKSPYKESDIPDPKTAYGISKLAGELFIRYMHQKHFIVRTSGLYGTAGCLGKGGGNFVENVINKAKSEQKIKVVTDEIVSPTYALDLAGKILDLIKTEKFGLYHITNSGQCSWWEFATEIFKITGQKIKVLKALSSDFKAKAHRPKYSVLENDRLAKIGLKPLRAWSEALKAYIREKGGN